MPIACLIVCEKKPRWAGALRAATGSGEIQIVETRTIAHCEGALRESPASLVAIEATEANLDMAVRLIERVGWQFPQARVVGLVAEEIVSAVPLLYEAGTIDVLTATWEAPRLVRLARRHLALAAQEELSFRDWAWQRMPWANQASAGG